MPIKKINLFLWFLIPKKSANELTGTAIKRIIEWTNSLSIESDTSPEVAIKNDGINKHWSAQTSDTVPANLSVVSCVLKSFMSSGKLF